MRRTASSRTVTLLTAVMATASISVPTNAAPRNGASRKPANVVKEYCRLDSEGARLSSETWPRVAPLVGWEEEPGWDTATLVSRYRIESTAVGPDHATVIVVFRILGRLEDDEPIAPASKYETLAFRLERAGADWKIVRPVRPPHVTVRSMIEHLRALLQHEKNESDQKEKLEKQLRQLEEWKK